jgi:Domain of unknown function (DUF222)
MLEQKALLQEVEFEETGAHLLEPGQILSDDVMSIWEFVSIPIMATTGWTRPSVLASMREVERLRRELDGAQAALVSALGSGARNTPSTIAHALNVSTRTARDQARIAAVIERIPGAGVALANATISVEHIRALACVVDEPDAASLLADAATQSPEAFIKTVAKFRLHRHPKTVQEQQRAERSVTFSRTDHGSITMRAVLPPIEGAELRNRIEHLADRRWQERNQDGPSGNRRDDTYIQCLADALVELTGDSGASSGGGRPTVVATIDVGTLEAELIGHGPIPTEDALFLANRADLYACIRDAKGGILKLGRQQRLASGLQQLALIIRDKQCTTPGCDQPWTRTEAHHEPSWEAGGQTDLNSLNLRCHTHHAHIHIEQRRTKKQNGGSVKHDPG